LSMRAWGLGLLFSSHLREGRPRLLYPSVLNTF
jgi:hypothetical protein